MVAGTPSEAPELNEGDIVGTPDDEGAGELNEDDLKALDKTPSGEDIDFEAMQALAAIDNQEAEEIMKKIEDL